VARPLWKGAISFGLVTIPVHVYSATRRSELRFRQLDRRDNSPVREKRVNQETNREVPWEEVVKGYEYDEGSFVVLTPDDFTQANVKATQTIDIVQAVPRDAVPPQYYETPLFVVPTKAGVKPYHILRETLRRTERLGVATIVMRGRQHLAALLADEQVLTLELLRFAHELRAFGDLELGVELEVPGIRPKELELAEQLVSMLDSPWQPEAYHDEYRDDLLTLIEKKAKKGRVSTQGGTVRAPRERQAEVVDMMELLKRSVGEARDQKTKRRRAAS
jgi:DNA end-binding protein Ku